MTSENNFGNSYLKKKTILLKIKTIKKGFNYFPIDLKVALDFPFHFLPDVEPGLTDWDTCVLAGVGLVPVEDPPPPPPTGPPLMV